MSDTDGDDRAQPPAEQDSGWLPRRPSIAGDDRLGARIGSAIVRPFAVFALNIVLLATRFAPGTTRFWRGWISAGYKGLAKTTSGATHVGHIERGGQLVHEPMAYKREGEGPVDEPRWQTAGGRWFQAPNKSSEISHVGKTPTVWASSQANDLGSWITAEVAEVLDMGIGEPLMKNAKLTVVNTDAENLGAGARRQAIADGGAPTLNVSVHDQGVLADRFVPLDTYDDRFSGRVVSMDKYYETWPDTADHEKMEKQRIAGKLEEKDPGAERAFMLKLFIVAGAVALGGLIGPEALGLLFGGGGGGGGGLLGLLPIVATRRRWW